MASIINAATSGGLISTADTSGVLALQTAGTTAVTVDASQKVGVGVTPSAWGSAYKAIQFGPQGVISNESTNSGFVSYGVNFYRNASAQWTYIETDTATKLTQYGGEFQFLAAPSGTAGNAITWTQILSASKGNTFALEGATATTGAGIAFPASQSASSDANTLDDYEEGTWTPTLSSITNWTGTPTTTYAKYIKIGKSVFIEFQFSGTVTSSSTTTSFIMTLPITATGTSVSGGANVAEGFSGVILANAATNCYIFFAASAGLTSGAHNPTGTATYSSAN